MLILKVILKIIERFYYMFLHGEKFNDIKSLCLVDYAGYFHDVKESDKAIKYYNKALNFNQNNFYAYGGLAAAFAEKGLFKEALNYCNKAISIKEKDLTINVLLVVIYEILGENSLSKEAFQKVLGLYKDNLAAVYNRLSYTYLHLKMYKEAENYCKEAIKIDPNEIGLQNNLAKIYLAQKNFQQAKEGRKGSGLYS